MIYTNLETLNDKGFSFEQVGIKAARLVADYGDGYTQAARIGSVEGLKAWRVKVDALPDLPGERYLIDDVQTRARYLWDFWTRHKLEKDCEVFIMRDPFPRTPSRPWVFARFAEESLEYDVLGTEYVFRVGLTLMEARLPYLDANDYNPQQV